MYLLGTFLGQGLKRWKVRTIFETEYFLELFLELLDLEH